MCHSRCHQLDRYFPITLAIALAACGLAPTVEETSTASIPEYEVPPIYDVDGDDQESAVDDDVVEVSSDGAEPGSNDVVIDLSQDPPGTAGTEGAEDQAGTEDLPLQVEVAGVVSRGGPFRVSSDVNGGPSEGAYMSSGGGFLLLSQ